MQTDPGGGYTLIRSFNYPLCMYDCVNNCSHALLHMRSQVYRLETGQLRYGSSPHFLYTAQGCIDMHPRLARLKRLESFCTAEEEEEKASMMVLVRFFRHIQSEQPDVVVSASVYIHRLCTSTTALQEASRLSRECKQGMESLGILFFKSTKKNAWKEPPPTTTTDGNYITRMESNTQLFFPMDVQMYACVAKGAILNVDDIHDTMRQLARQAQAKTNIPSQKDPLVFHDKTLIVASCTSHEAWRQLIPAVQVIETIEHLSWNNLQSHSVFLVSPAFLHHHRYSHLVNSLKGRYPDMDLHIAFRRLVRTRPSLTPVPLGVPLWGRVVYQDALAQFQNPVTLRSSFRWGLVKQMPFRPDAYVTIHQWVFAMLQFCYSEIQEQQDETLVPNLDCPVTQFLLGNSLFRFDKHDFTPSLLTPFSANSKNVCVMCVQPSDVQLLLWSRISVRLDDKETQKFCLDPDSVGLTEDRLILVLTEQEFQTTVIQPLLDTNTKSIWAWLTKTAKPAPSRLAAFAQNITLEDECIICYDQPARVFLSNCLHSFCRACLLRAEPSLYKTCPCCKVTSSKLIHVTNQEDRAGVGRTFYTPMFSQLCELISNHLENCTLVLCLTRAIALLCHRLLNREFKDLVSTHMWMPNRIILGSLTKSYSATVVISKVKHIIVLGGSSLDFGCAKKKLQARILIDACPDLDDVTHLPFPVWP